MLLRPVLTCAAHLTLPVRPGPAPLELTNLLLSAQRTQFSQNGALPHRGIESVATGAAHFTAVSGDRATAQLSWLRFQENFSQLYPLLDPRTL